MTYIPSQFGVSGLTGHAAQVTALLNAMVGDSGAGGTKGAVPAPGAGDAAAGKVLTAGGIWDTAGGTVLHTFTPIVKFGGAHVGQSFSGQHGNYVQLENIVLGCVNIVFTAKGSSTGNATLSMPPAPVFVGGSPLVGGGILLDSSGFASTPTDTPILIFINGSNDAAIQMAFTGGLGEMLQLTHSNFTDDTIMRGIFCYLTDTF